MDERRFTYTDPEGNEYTFILGGEMWDDLTDDQIARIYAIQDVLDEVEPKTIPERIKGFLSDVDPEVEIQIFEAIVSVYQEINRKYKLNLQEKDLLYRVLCVLSMGGEKTTRRVWADKKHLPSLRKIKRMFRKAWASIPPKDYSAYERKYGPGGQWGGLFFE